MNESRFLYLSFYSSFFPPVIFPRTITASIITKIATKIPPIPFAIISRAIAMLLI